MKLAIKIAGPAGFGIKVTGQILAKVFLHLGNDVFAYTEYPSLIRGGHNTFQIDVADKRQSTNAPAEKANILIALTAEAIDREAEKISKNGAIIFDQNIKPSSLKSLKILEKNKIKLIQSPLIEISQKCGGELMKNTVALGVLLGLLDLPLENLKEILLDTFGHKKVAAEQNVKTASEGYAFGKKNNNQILKSPLVFKPLKNKNLLVSGNQACALGAIAAGCQFYSAYPMTPATEILHYLEAKQKETKMLVHQGEDEIAVIHAAIGASFVGARAACGTSGGGFALMTEGLSLASQVETPLIIFEVMRPAPATGLPTWTEQGDLQFVLNAGHGDFARIILAPGNPAECFTLTQKAFNLADKYQIPVFILTDKFLAESYYTVDNQVFNQVEKISRGKVIKNLTIQPFNNSLFARYKVEKDGVSWHITPGIEGGEHVANSDEHDEFGLSTESGEVRKAQMDKRLQKLAELQKEIPLPILYGPRDAKTTLVCWGSMLGPCLDAVAEKKTLNVLHFSYVYPLPVGLNKFLKKFKRLILVENNAVGQFGKLLRQETGVEIDKKILKYDGRPFWSNEIEKLI